MEVRGLYAAPLAHEMAGAGVISPRELVIADHVWPDRIDALIRMGLGREQPPGGFAFD